MKIDKVCRDWLNATKLENSPMRLPQEGDNVPLPEKPVSEGSKVIMLPEPELLPDREMSFLELAETRQSVRQYSTKPLTLKDLSYLLWCTQGVKMQLPDNTTRRTVPSAGGQHPFETYMLINNVESVRPGLYRYLAMGNALLPISREAEKAEAFISCFRAVNMVRKSAVTFVWAAVTERMTYKFNNRGFRYIFIEAGHVCENLYLAALAKQDMGACAIGGFYDDKLNKALGLDGKEEFAVYAATLGKL